MSLCRHRFAEHCYCSEYAHGLKRSKLASPIATIIITISEESLPWILSSFFFVSLILAGPTAAAAGNDRIPIVPKVEHTRFGNGTGATLTYSLDDDRTVVVELRERLPHRTFLERQGQRRNEPPIVEYFDERCYYQGWIVGRPGSAVALSTCEGRVRGTVLDLDGAYYIDFDEASGGHYVQR